MISLTFWLLATITTTRDEGDFYREVAQDLGYNLDIDGMSDLIRSSKVVN